MSKAPEVDGEIVRLNFDGLFDEPTDNVPIFEMDSHTYYPQIESQKEQVWIHENTINTLVRNMAADGAQATLDATTLMKAFPEIANLSKGANFTTKTSLHPMNEGVPVHMTVKDGIMVGANKDLKLKMELYADDKLQCNFDIGAMAKVNFTMWNTVFYPRINEVEVLSAQVKHCEVPLHPGKQYDEIFDRYFSGFVTAWNTKYDAGVALGELVPVLGMISGVLHNSTLTPYVADGWMMGGFSMQEDMTSKVAEESYELKFLTN
jgi:hypothetical protein